MQNSSARLLAVTAVATLGILSTPALNAQTPSQTPPPAAGNNSPAPSANVSDEKLDAAAAAIQRVASLKQDYQEKMASASPDEKDRISNEATGALTKAVTDQGLTVEEYTRILQVAENDTGVREKIMQRIRPADRQK